MRASQKTKILIDAAMAAALVSALCFGAADGLLHELAGALFCALAIAHNALNAGFYKNIFRPKRPFEARAAAFISCALAAAALAMAASGLLHSKFILGFLEIESPMRVRQVHAIAGYWVFALAAAHLGLHKKVLEAKLPPSRPARAAAKAALFAVSACGLYFWVERDMFGKLFLGYSFDFVPEQTRAFIFPAMASVFVFMGHAAHIAFEFLEKLVKRKPWTEKHSSR